MPSNSNQYLSGLVNRRFTVNAACLFVLLLGLIQPASRAEDKVTYVNDVMPILRNSCLNCHNPDKHKAGLDLTTYQATMEGSDNGKVIEPGNPGNSLLFKLINHADEPAMPPKSDKLPDSQIEIIRRWIAGHALENADSKAAIAKDGAAALEMFAQEKASGPVPMPHDLLLEPAVRTSRAGSVVSMAASPRAPIVAVAAQKQVLLYNTQTLELAGVLPFPEGFPLVVKFSRDGRLVMAGGGVGAKSGRVVAWDVSTGRRVTEAGDEYDEVMAADISPDYHLIALGGPSRMVKVFRDGKLLYSIKKHTDWVTALAFTSDGKLLVSGDRQGGLEVWEMSTGSELFTLPSHKAGVTALAAPGPEACFSASEDGTVKLWDLHEGKEVKSWTAHKEGTLAVAFSPDGRIVTCGRDKMARLWSSDGSKQFDSEPFGDVALSAAISGDRIVAGDWSGTIRVWDSNGKRLAEWTPNPPTVEEQLAAAEARILKLQETRSKDTALLADAEQQAKQSGAASQAAAQAAAEKEKVASDAAARLATVKGKADDAETAVQKVRQDYDQLLKAGDGLKSDMARAVASNDTAQNDAKSLEGAMQEAQAKAAQLAEIAKAAQAQADSHPGDASLADAAAKAKADADKAAEDLVAATARETEAQRAKEALAKLSEASAGNKDALQAVQKKLDQLTAAAEPLRTELAAAQQSSDKAKAEYDALAKGLPPKAEEAKNAEEKLAKIKHDLEQAGRELSVEKGLEAKWKAAQLNITLYAARQELADRQADYDKAVEAARQVSAELDKAKADLAAEQKLLADAPSRIKAAQDAIPKARERIASTTSVTDQAKKTLTGKEQAEYSALDNAIKLGVQSLITSDDLALRFEAARARESLNATRRDETFARKDLSAQNAAVKQAADNLTAAQKALDKTNNDAAAAPGQIEKLSASIDEITKRTASARAAADAVVTAASQPVAAVKAKVDALARDYEALLKEAETAHPVVAELTKK